MPITAQQRKKFVRLVTELNALLKEIRKTEPEANYYLQEDTMHLMKGDSHSGLQGIRRDDNSVEAVLMPHSGGGAW